MFRKFVSGLLIATFATASSASQLANVQGAVFVDYGAGFRPVAGAALVTAGNRVRTGDGSAEIVYDGGCTQYIGPNQAALVLAAPPGCASQSLKDPPEPAGVSTGTLLVGGLLLAGGGGVGIYYLTKPASP